MSKRPFEKIKAGLDSAQAYLSGTADKRRYRVHLHDTVDVRDAAPMPARRTRHPEVRAKRASKD
jgi:hypothetical protein